MKTILASVFFALFFGLGLQVAAQAPEFAPVGAKWYYGCDSATVLSVTKDTLIQNKLCKIVDREKGNSYHQRTIFHESDNKLFYWADTSFRLLMDYNLEKGDTLVLNPVLCTGDSGGVKKQMYIYNYVDSVFYTSINGKEYKTFILIPFSQWAGLFNYCWDIGFGGTYIQSIGNIGGFFFISRTFSEPSDSPLIRYTDNEIDFTPAKLFTSDNWADSHDYNLIIYEYGKNICILSNLLDKIETSFSNFFYNYNNKTITSKSIVFNKNYNFEIFDINGVKLVETNYTPELDVSVLKTGLYIIKVSNQSSIYFDKLLIY